MGERASSETRLSPAVLRQALDASGDTLTLLTRDGIVCGGAGAPDGGAAVGAAWAGLWAVADREDAAAAVRAAGDGRKVTLDCARVDAAGRVGHWRHTLAPLAASGPDEAAILVVSRDVTKEHLTRVALETRDRLHEAMIEATSEIVWHYETGQDRTHREGWSEFTGRSIAEQGDFHWLDCVHPQDRDRTLAQIEAAVSARRPYVVEYRLWHVSGQWRWVEDHGVPIVGVDGTSVDWTGVASDIHARKAAEHAVRDSEMRLRLAVEATGLGIWDLDIVTGARQWSDELKAMLGLEPDAVPSKALLASLVHPDDREVLAAYQALTSVPGGEAIEATFRIIRQNDGEVRWIKSRGGRVLDGDDGSVRRVGSVRDVTEERATHLALGLALRRHEALISATSEIVWRANADQTQGDGSGWTEFTGQDKDDANGDGWLRSVHPDDRARAVQVCSDAIVAGSAYTNEYRLFHAASGEWHWIVDRVVPLHDADGRLVEWVGIIADIQERRVAEETIWRAAHTDHLTGLANRALFQSRLDQAVAGAVADGGCLALILIDLDHFKETNDSLGHDAGDFTLQAVAAALTGHAPPGALVARLGGDEFGVILPGADARRVLAIATDFLAAINRPLSFGGLEIDSSATAGFAIYPLHDPDPSALLKNADIALYAAKSSGRGRVLAFGRAMRADLDRRVNVLRNARDALARDAVVPFYQPKVSLADGRVIGFEALLRWNDGHRLRAPGDIREAFEDHDLAIRLGAQMLARVGADMARWQAAGIDFGRVALNVAAPEFQRGDFVSTVLRHMADHGLAAGRLEVEVTESVFLADGADEVRQALTALDEAGIAIALDDFGTGYASLTHLKTYPVSWLKIDRSFISNLETEPDSAAIVQAVLGMARNIGIRVVAEGVETEWQLQFLRQHGCEVAQGYRLARPMDGSRVPHFLAGWRADRLGAGPAAMAKGLSA